jgi:hypothetical protein
MRETVFSQLQRASRVVRSSRADTASYALFRSSQALHSSMFAERVIAEEALRSGEQIGTCFGQLPYLLARRIALDFVKEINANVSLPRPLNKVTIILYDRMLSAMNRYGMPYRSTMVSTSSLNRSKSF